MRDRHNLWRRIILAGVLLCLILAGFFVYLHATRNMTVERNANYVADAASQTAKRIDDLLVGAENSISAIAHMYEQSMDPAQADVEMLDKLTESTVFDYIGYVNADGSIRARSGNLPMLLLIDNNWITVEEDARRAGASGFLPAPFAMSTLKKAVSECGSQLEEQAVDNNEPTLEGLRMLVAEDNDINAEILMELLDVEGVTCERAVNGLEAVSMFQSKPVGYYDGVLMDIQMPEMNGYEATRAIRALNRSDAVDIPIVAMTANAFAEDVQKSLEAGMNAHIAKPVDLKILKSVLSKLTGQRNTT